MWKIAVKYQIGLSELKSANPHIKNPDLIYPGDVLTIPALDSKVSAYEKEVIRLVNIEREKNGLSPLKEDW
jgi:spore coat assembly protein SafA